MPKLISRNLTISDDRRIGREGTHRKLAVSDVAGKATMPVIWFYGADTEVPTGPVDLVYNLSVNEFRGQRSAQLQFVAIRPAQAMESDNGPQDGRCARRSRSAPPFAFDERRALA